MQEQKKTGDDIDVLALPPRSERSLIDEEELTSRVGINKHKEEIKRRMRMRHLIIKTLLCLFIPIPIIFIIYMYHPHLFDAFKQDNVVSDAIFETIHISRAEERKEEKEDETKSEQSNAVEKEADPDSITDDVEEKQDNENYVYHIVKEGETLYTISMEYFRNRGGEEIIRRENNLSAGELEPGQRIRIPKNSVD